MAKSCINKYLLVTLFMLIIFVLLFGCDSSETPTEETAIGNHANGGLVAGKEDLVHFINPANIKL